MPKIIDATLTMLEEYPLSRAQIEEFIYYLNEMSIHTVVITPRIYEILEGCLSEEVDYYMELPFGVQQKTGTYKGIKGFISNTGSGMGNSIKNIQMNDLVELNAYEESTEGAHIRIKGLDDFLLYESERIYQAGMEKLKRMNPIFYPEDSYYCATAIVLDYLRWQKKGTVMTTFFGMGNKAATEQVLLALRVIERYKPNISFEKIACLRDVFEEMIGRKIPGAAPVIGRDIFHIESGVHVDGILKKASNYEAYEPELVGAKREIVLGKHSGGTSVSYKLKQFGIQRELNKEHILEKVKRRSIKKSGPVTDEEFLEIVHEEIAG